jgi:hypothetical protein
VQAGTPQGDLFWTVSIIGCDAEPLSGKARVVDDKTNVEAPTQAAKYEASLIIGLERKGPCTTGSLWGTIVQRALSPETEIAGLAKTVNSKLNSDRWPAVEIDHSAPNDLLGEQANLGCGLIRVQVKLCPAEPRCRSQGICLEETS